MAGVLAIVWRERLENEAGAVSRGIAEAAGIKTASLGTPCGQST